MVPANVSVENRASIEGQSSQSSEAVKHHAGMGAILTEQGVAFRVWAPHAQAVSVVGDFNDWQETQHPLSQEYREPTEDHEQAGTAPESVASGFWYGEVTGLSVGAEYLYALKLGENWVTRIDPYAKEVTNSVGHSVVADPEFDWQDDAFQLPPRNELIIYEMHIGTFAKDAGDGQPGTLSAAIRQLDHLKRMGVNCVEIMPLAEFAGDFSWGYNPAHIFAVESSYGGPKAFKEFVREAHKRGIGVILDVVYNHFGPSDLSLWQFDGWSENQLGGIYFYNDWRAETPWGSTRPDYSRPEVRQYLRDNALYWLDEFHCDGLRFDMTLYIRSVRGDGDPGCDLPDGWSLTQWINSEIHARHPQALTIAEDLHNKDELTAPVERGGAAFSAQWDARFVHPVREVLIEPDDDARSLDSIKGAIFATFNGDPFERVIYTESHDEVANGKARIPSEVMPHETRNWFAQKRATLGLALVMTTPGIPMVFQGQEFLEDGWFRDDVPLDWDKAIELKGILRLFRDLCHLRVDKKGVSRGLTGSGIALLHEDHAAKTLAFHRWHTSAPQDDIVVILNFYREPRKVEFNFPHAATWQLELNSDASIYSPEFANTACIDHLNLQDETANPAHHASLEVGPYSALIFSRQT
ncbi:alpha-amylase family glycosyl hydrolase [Planctopirus hydrillae]|uniref:1,4-alpha-glucan branching enzyme n=1 Tax=Planctopirus hydrillae TaxID=1841610 RepID=A0A1C3EAT8_9PLAN|nr:alpha-amylase family glycosyl hydrolase [Planctopirus hydrillae]ODA30353.1 1,4-alpha-glucan branching protein [Planctopirus hydrillae]